MENRLKNKNKNTNSPDVRTAIQHLQKAITAGGKKTGDTDERLHNVAAWREAPFYTDGERAALALTEAATRLQDGAPGVTDEIWEEANAHFTEEQIGAINLEIALTNFFNRINRTIKEPVGKTWG